MYQHSHGTETYVITNVGDYERLITYFIIFACFLDGVRSLFKREESCREFSLCAKFCRRSLSGKERHIVMLRHHRVFSRFFRFSGTLGDIPRWETFLPFMSMKSYFVLHRLIAVFVAASGPTEITGKLSMSEGFNPSHTCYVLICVILNLRILFAPGFIHHSGKISKFGRNSTGIEEPNLRLSHVPFRDGNE